MGNFLSYLMYNIRLCRRKICLLFSHYHSIFRLKGPCMYFRKQAHYNDFQRYICSNHINKTSNLQLFRCQKATRKFWLNSWAVFTKLVELTMRKRRNFQCFYLCKMLWTLFNLKISDYFTNLYMLKLLLSIQTGLCNVTLAKYFRKSTKCFNWG